MNKQLKRILIATSIGLTTLSSYKTLASQGVQFSIGIARSQSKKKVTRAQSTKAPAKEEQGWGASFRQSFRNIRQSFRNVLNQQSKSAPTTDSQAEDAKNLINQQLAEGFGASDSVELVPVKKNQESSTLLTTSSLTSPLAEDEDTSIALLNFIHRGKVKDGSIRDSQPSSFEDESIEAQRVLEAAGLRIEGRIPATDILTEEEKERLKEIERRRALSEQQLEDFKKDYERERKKDREVFKKIADIESSLKGNKNEHEIEAASRIADERDAELERKFAELLEEEQRLKQILEDSIAGNSSGRSQSQIEEDVPPATINNSSENNPPLAEPPKKTSRRRKRSDLPKRGNNAKIIEELQKKLDIEAKYKSRTKSVDSRLASNPVANNDAPPPAMQKQEEEIPVPPKRASDPLNNLPLGDLKKMLEVEKAKAKSQMESLKDFEEEYQNYFAAQQEATERKKETERERAASLLEAKLNERPRIDDPEVLKALNPAVNNDAPPSNATPPPPSVAQEQEEEVQAPVQIEKWNFIHSNGFNNKKASKSRKRRREPEDTIESREIYTSAGTYAEVVRRSEEREQEELQQEIRKSAGSISSQVAHTVPEIEPENPAAGIHNQKSKNSEGERKKRKRRGKKRKAIKKRLKKEEELDGLIAEAKSIEKKASETLSGSMTSLNRDLQRRYREIKKKAIELNGQLNQQAGAGQKPTNTKRDEENSRRTGSRKSTEVNGVFVVNGTRSTRSPVIDAGSEFYEDSETAQISGAQNPASTLTQRNAGKRIGGSSIDGDSSSRKTRASMRVELDGTTATIATSNKRDANATNGILKNRTGNGQSATTNGAPKRDYDDFEESEKTAQEDDSYTPPFSAKGQSGGKQTGSIIDTSSGTGRPKQTSSVRTKKKRRNPFAEAAKKQIDRQKREDAAKNTSAATSNSSKKRGSSTTSKQRRRAKLEEERLRNERAQTKAREEEARRRKQRKEAAAKRAERIARINEIQKDRHSETRAQSRNTGTTRAEEERRRASAKLHEREQLLNNVRSSEKRRGDQIKERMHEKARRGEEINAERAEARKKQRDKNAARELNEKLARRPSPEEIIDILGAANTPEAIAKRRERERKAQEIVRKNAEEDVAVPDLFGGPANTEEAIAKRLARAAASGDIEEFTVPDLFGERDDDDEVEAALPPAVALTTVTVNLTDGVAAEVNGQEEKYSEVVCTKTSDVNLKIKADKSTVRNKQSKNVKIAKATGNIVGNITLEVENANPFTEYSEPMQHADGSITYKETGVATRVINETAYGGAADSETLSVIDNITGASADSDAGTYTDTLEEMYRQDPSKARGKSKESVEGLINPGDHIKNIMDLSGGTLSRVDDRVNDLGILVTQNDDDITGISAGNGDEKYGVWLSPYYSSLVKKKRGNIAGSNVISKGTMVGFDTRFNEDLILGGAFSFVNTKIKGKDTKLNDRTNVDSYLATIYSNKNLNDNWFVRANVSLGFSKVEKSSKRVASLDSYEEVTGKYRARSFSGEAILGYNSSNNNFTITPMFGLRYNHIKSKDYKEKGSTTGQNLKVSGVNYHNLEALVGAVISGKKFKVNSVFVTPEITGNISHNLLNNRIKQRAEMQGAGNILKKGIKPIKTRYKVGLGFKIESGNVEYKVNYSTNFNRKSIGHEGICKLRINF